MTKNVRLITDESGTPLYGVEVDDADIDYIHEPPHYAGAHPSGIEPIQITRYETFLRGNIIKYVMRAPYKGTELQDLKKARQYLVWEIERLEQA